MVAPSGEQHEITGGGYRAVVTECGAGLRLLEYAGTPLVAGYAEDSMATAGRGQLLLPWPNRVEDGAYSYGGRELRLPLSEPARGHASHGLVRWLSWRVADHAASSVRLVCRLLAQPGYPWTLDVAATYALSDEGLEVTVTATNRGGSPAPYALGAHPYLTVGGDAPVDEWEVTLAADTVLLTDERKIPRRREPVGGTVYDFRGGRLVGDTVLDHAFTDLVPDEDGRVTVRVRHPETGRSVALWMDGRHRVVQLFTGDGLPEGARASLAVEPMTAPPNAFRTGAGVVALAPDEVHVARWGLRAGG